MKKTFKNKLFTSVYCELFFSIFDTITGKNKLVVLIQ